jgi:hypothetical protein
MLTCHLQEQTLLHIQRIATLFQRFLLLTVTCVVFVLLTPGNARSNEITFRLRSWDTYRVQLEFYSQNRKHAWPGDGTVYVLRDYNIHEYTLSCITGEVICYGAWMDERPSQYWGSGYNGKQACRSCCFTCDGSQTPVLNLNE